MLHVAAYKGRNDVISYLLGIGADPNILDVVSIVYNVIYYGLF